MWLSKNDQSAVRRQLYRAADIRCADLDMPGQIGQFQHRHHAIDGNDGDSVHVGVPGRGQLRVGRQSIDVGHFESGICNCPFNRFQGVRSQGNVGGAGDL